MSILGRGQGQQPSIVLRTQPGLTTADVSDTETVSSTVSATSFGPAAQPIVVSADPNRAYWNQQHQPPAIVLSAHPGLTTADVSDTETVSTTATATATNAGTQPIVVSADPNRAYWNQQHQPPAIVSSMPPGLATADVSDTETVSTTTAVTATSQGTQPIVVTADPARAFWNQQHQPPAIVTLPTQAGLATADVSDTETATTTTAIVTSQLGTQPIVVTPDPSRALWNQEHQPPAIVLATPPGLVTVDVSDTETVTTTATASTIFTPPQPIVVTPDPSRALWNQEHQPPAIVLATPPGLATANVTDTETVSTTTAVTVAGQGTQPIVVTADPSRAFWNQEHQPPAIVLAAPPGLVTAAVTDTEIVSTTASASASQLGTQPIVVVAEPSKAFWNQVHQPPAILVEPTAPGLATANVTDTETVTTTTSTTSAGPAAQPTVISPDPNRAYWDQQKYLPPAIVSSTPPGLVTVDVSDTITVSTTATAATGASVTDTETATTTTSVTVTGQGTQPLVISDLTETYWTSQRSRRAIVIIQPPGATTADVSDVETVADTVSATGTPPSQQPAIFVISDQLGPYLARATNHQPPALLIVTRPGQVAVDVTSTIAAVTLTTSVLGATPTETDVTTATAATPTAPKKGSWYELLETMQLARDSTYGQPRYLTCPRDGEPFRQGPNGEWYCKFDGYRPGQDGDLKNSFVGEGQ